MGSRFDPILDTDRRENEKYFTECSGIMSLRASATGIVFGG
jgi:hypothetical protein